uniref:Uncharacterized protein n=1 Tax=Trichogramma kaykai TaxID=54128 RepID=A0ABD2WAH3_9HYME
MIRNDTLRNMWGAAKVWRHLKISHNKRRKKIKNLITDVFFDEESNAKRRETLDARKTHIHTLVRPKHRVSIRALALPHKLVNVCNKTSLPQDRSRFHHCCANRVGPGIELPRIISCTASHRLLLCVKYTCISAGSFLGASRAPATTAAAAL